MEEKQHTPILTGLRTLAGDQEWEVEVVPLVVGQRSVKEKEWWETLKIFGIGKDLWDWDGMKNIVVLTRERHVVQFVSPSLPREFRVWGEKCVFLFTLSSIIGLCSLSPRLENETTVNTPPRALGRVIFIINQ